jgi:hypothetical protein
MVFNLKGLMESVKPVDIGIGALESINESFVEKKKLDEAYARVAYDEALNVLAESEEKVNTINTNLARFNKIAQTFSPEVADFMAQDGVFDLYSDQKDLAANNNLDIQARLYRNKILKGEYTPSENPYMADTKAELIKTLNTTRDSLKNANNIPENTFAIALQSGKIEKQIRALEEGNLISPTKTDERQITFTSVSPFPVGTSGQISSEIIYDNIKTAQFLKVNFLDAEEMNRIGLPAVSVEDATKLFGAGNFIPTINQLEDRYPMFVSDRQIAAQGENPDRSVANVVQRYTQMYQEDLKTQIEQRIDTFISPDSITAFLPDRKFAIREKYINDFMITNKVDRATAINALSNASPDGSYQPDIFLALSQ